MLYVSIWDQVALICFSEEYGLAQDKNYIIAYKVGIYESFENGELAEVYDLSKDPDGLNNINDKIDRTKIEYLLNPIHERFDEIKRDTNEFIEKLRKEQ